jgi:DNA mismatch repair protein MutS2
MIYPDNYEIKTGFDRVRDLIKSECLCELGKREVDEASFQTSFEMFREWLEQTDEFRRICLFENSFPLSWFIDVTPFLSRIKVEGAYLEPHQLFDIRRSLDSIRAILAFFKKKEVHEYPRLISLTKEVNVYPALIDKIDAVLTNHGKIKDNASPELAQVRREINARQGEVSRIMQRVLRAAQKAGIVDDESGVSIRDGRAVIPVLASFKRKLPGIIHDESATGKTSFIEPAEVVEANNQIRELEFAEKREVTRVLIAVTDFFRLYLDELVMAYAFMGKIDFIRAKALFALKINGVLPKLVDNPIVDWQRAVHPILYLNLKKEGREVIPLNITLDVSQRILLISGPNAGGKSVCLKTVGLLQYMLQCGILIPVSENSEAGVFRDIFIDIGDEQSIENDLSTYSSHLHNMKHFVRNASGESLVLIDEFGTGTEPMLGGAIAESILDRLNKAGVYGVITTHYTNLKHFASSAEGILNGAMMYDSHVMEPLFVLEMGKPGSSFAFEIARKIGLPEDILQAASDRVGKDHIDFDKHLRDIVRDKRYWETKRARIKDSEKKLESVVERYEKELQEILTQKKTILQKAKEEASTLLNGANRQIENTIRQIKEAHAEKEKTREARKEIEVLKEQIQVPDGQEDEWISRKIEQLKTREKRKQDRVGKQKESPGDTKPVIEKVIDDASIQTGDKVRLFGQDTVGEVLDVNGKNLMVAFGSMITTVHENRLEKVSEKEYKKIVKNQAKGTTGNYSETIMNRKLEFKPRIDVRGKRADEALDEVQGFIDEAIMVGAGEVKILHGKGNGILRQMIRDYLHGLSVVESYRDELVEFGGAGITVVKIG